MSEVSPPSEAVVTVDVPDRGRIFHRPLFWLIASIVIVAGGIAVWYFWPTPNDQPSKTAALKYDKVHADVEDLRRTKNYSEAAAKLDTFAAQTSDKTLKMNAMLEEATIYESQGKFPEALKEYQAVEAINKNPIKPELAGIARCAQSLKNYPLAITYYQKTIDALPKDSPLYHAEVQGYQQIIDQINQQQAKS